MKIKGKGKGRKITYPFELHTTDGNGKKRTFVHRCPVRYATKPVDIILEADHVRKSIKLKGVGNTQTCSMSVCVLNHEDKFPHPVEGFVDWSYSRAVVVTSLDKAGWPNKAIEYRHYSKIAPLNDSLDGQRKLLQILEENGPITIHLLPIKVRDREAAIKHAEKMEKIKSKRASNPKINIPSISDAEISAGKKPGIRSKWGIERKLGYGAKRRFAVAQLGRYVPEV